VLDPAPPIQRYTHEAPGDLLHLDIKKLGRFKRPGHRMTGDRQAGRSPGAGWDYVHMAIDDHSRVSHATIWPNEKGVSAVAALIAALRYLPTPGRALWSRAHRQWRLLSLTRVRQGVSPTRAQTPENAAVPSAHQRQGRAADPNGAPRVGVCPRLRECGSTRGASAALAA